MGTETWQNSGNYDVIVVGSGAVGGWAALELGRLGLKVLVLEAGPDGGDAPRVTDPSEFDGQRALDRLLRRRRVQARHSAYWELDPALFVDDAENPYRVAPNKSFDWIRTRQLNGRLLTWGGVCVRVSDRELRAPEEDGFGPSWPLAYTDLVEHFDRIDDFWPIYGETDNLPQMPDGKYVGQCAWTESERRLQRYAATRGGPQIVAARGVMIRAVSRPNGELPPPSPIRAAAALPGVVVRTNAVVKEIAVDGSGRATGVVFVDRETKAIEEARARTVALCASTIESTRILLNSKSAAHPGGLGASSGVLGRYLMDHPAIHLTGFMPGERDVAWTDGYAGPKNIMIPRFRNLTNKSSGKFLRGWGAFGHVGRWVPPADCEPSEVPVSLVAYGEMLPRQHNQVRLVNDEVDAWGIPIVEIDCAFSDNEVAMQDDMEDTLSDLLEAAGGRVKEVARIAPGGFVHEMGTARMGDRPSNSVVNRFGQVWDSPNVFVMDGAVWPSGAWQNPTLAMMAFAGLACRHLATELRR